MPRPCAIGGSHDATGGDARHDPAERTDCFRIAPVPGRPILEVAIGGLMTLADVADLAARQARMLVLLRFAPRGFDALIDVTASPIQPQPVSAALSALAERADFQPARLVFVHGDAPVKIQARRLAVDRQAHLFRDRAAALAWLS